MTSIPSSRLPRVGLFFALTSALFSVGCDSASETAQAAPPPPRVTEEVEAPVPDENADEPLTYYVSTFDFVDNRHLAHLWDGGIVLDLGHASGARYVQGRWNSPWYDDATVDGRKVAHPRGVSGTVRFPLHQAEGVDDATGSDGWAIQVRLQPNGSQRCDLFWSSADGEEEKIGSLNSIEEGWGTYTVDLPKPEIGREYTLRLHFSRSREISGGRRSAAAIDWIRVGPKSDDAPVSRGEVFAPKESAIRLEPGQSVSWYTVLGPDARLLADTRGSGTLVVRADGAEPKRWQLDGAADIELGAFAGRGVRITMAAGSEPLTLKKPRLAAMQRQLRPREEGPRVVLVWVIDTMRADHLPAYNPDTDVFTPHLDVFVKEAALFTNATVQGNSSLPTSASIFTGAYTVTHELVRESGKLQESHTVLAEPFDRAGWKTALYSSNGYVSNSWGFARGFQKEVNPIRESRPSDTSVLWPEAKEWLAQAAEDPEARVFLYINTVDPHVPYDPPQEHLERYHRGGRVGKVSPRGTGELLHDAAAGKVAITAAERDYMLALYKGEITDNDAWFGKMRADLEQLGIADETMIVVTSDHGEEFGEYGRYGHGVSVNQELVDVPFIVGYRPWTKPGVAVDDAVEVIDLFPTVADAAGFGRIGPQVQGRSLVLDILDPSVGHPTIAFSYHNDFLRGARVGGWKYQLFNGDNDRVYDLSDRDGTWDDENLAAERPILRRAMRDAMAFQVGFDTKWKKSEHGWVNNQTAAAAAWLDDEGW